MVLRGICTYCKLGNRFVLARIMDRHPLKDKPDLSRADKSYLSRMHQ